MAGIYLLYSEKWKKIKNECCSKILELFTTQLLYWWVDCLKEQDKNIYKYISLYLPDPFSVNNTHTHYEWYSNIHIIIFKNYHWHVTSNW